MTGALHAGMVPVLASVTDSLVTFATHVIRDLGVGGVLLLTVTSATIGLPGTEPTMLFAGFNVFQHHLSLPGIIIFGVLGDLLGASIAFAIGYYGRRELLERHGGKLHISQRRLDLAHGWFERYGPLSIFVSRLVPIVRAAFPYVAGVAQTSYTRFLLPAAAGSVIWIGGLGILGREVGHQWPTWRRHLEIVDYIGAAIVLGAVALLIARWWRGRGSGPGGAPAADLST